MDLDCDRSWSISIGVAVSRCAVRSESHQLAQIDGLALSRGGQPEATLLFDARASIDTAPEPHRHCMYAVWEKASIIYPILIWPYFFLKWTLLAIFVDH